MRRLLLAIRVHVLTVVVATSYLTLGIFSPDEARSLWAPYAAVTFVLAISNLIVESSRERS